jgi:hypothetical protein
MARLPFGLPRQLWVVQAGVFLNYLGWGGVMPFELIYLHDGRGFGLGVAGLVVGNSLRLKARQELDALVAEKRFGAYGAMWDAMRPAAPMDVLRGKTGTLDRDARTAIYDALTEWYFGTGNGMLLAPQTRLVYLEAKKNLICPVEQFTPASLRDRVADDAARDLACRRQLSLLRTSMRADVALYSRAWGAELGEEDIAFLEAAGVDVTKRPWSVPGRERREPVHDG